MFAIRRSLVSILLRNLRRKYDIKMGNSNGKKALTGGDLEFLREHTSITHDDQAMYENFIVKHPDGTIARKEFRLMILINIPFCKLL